MRLRTKLAAVGVGAATLAVAGVAFASWSSSGSGNGSAATTHDTPSVISAHLVAAPADLYPGAKDTVTVDISNPNPYPVVVTSISDSSSPEVNTTVTPSCAAGSVFTDAVPLNRSGIAQTTGAVKIGPGGGGTYALVGHMISDPTDACKSQSFPLTLTATLQSAA